MRTPAAFETQRLRLRPPRLDDAKAIFDGYAADPEVTRYLTWRPHTSVAVTESFLRQFMESIDEGPDTGWLIESKQDQTVIGAASISRQGHKVSIGYCLARRIWGQGMMTEAMRPILDWALAQPDIHRVWATCDVDNPASARVMEKLGMQAEGILHRWLMHPNISDEPRDAYCYAIVR